MVRRSVLDDDFDWFGLLLETLAARKYSRRTRQRYLSIMKNFEEFLEEKSLDSMIEEDVRRYIALLEQSGASTSTLNQAISAIKYFCANVLGEYLAIDFRPRADHKLPEILSQHAIEQVIDNATIPRNKLAIALAYSAGLRPSEVAALKITDIDIRRKTILVRSGKGRKDRYTLLATKTLNLLQQYMTTASPQHWLFPGNPDGHITIRALQYMMMETVQKAGLASRASMRTLRHSFATHLVENGSSLLSVRDLLGHASLSTTQVYLQTARLDALKSVSPYDYKKP